MNDDDTTAPTTMQSETDFPQETREPDDDHGGYDHDCEFCSPPLVTMPPPQGRPHTTREQSGDPLGRATI